MRYHPLLAALAASGILAGCSDQPTQPGAPRNLADPPSFAIVDGAHGGNQEFYFLPPIVPAPSYSGTFDATQHPEVRICALAGTSCGSTIVSFSGSQVKLSTSTEAYSVSWKTKDAGLDPSKTYRIQVLLGTQVLGYADVVVVANGSQIKTVDKGQYVAVINGGTVPIKFRIETAPPPPPPPGLWQNGDLVTYSADRWGTLGTAAANLLMNNFFTVFTSGYVEIGIAGAGGFSAAFTSAQAVFDYLPTTGVPGALDNDVVDPTSTSAGYFGSFVLALQLSVDFTDSGGIAATSGLKFGNLRLCALTTTAAYNNLTVRQFLAAMNTALGGGPAAYSFDDMANLAYDVSLAFEAGVPSSFAQAHLVNGSCPGGWQNGQVITHTQLDWGAPVSSAGILLNNAFSSVYSASGVLEAGLPGNSGFSMLFTSSGAVLAYLPAIGNVGALNADLIDPTSTASGAFGGEVVALKVNIDFAAAGHMVGSSGLQFGALTLCGFSSNPALNGISVNGFLTMLNSALGGGPAPYTISELHLLTEQVNAAFSNGSPSLFAQAHLANGACP